MVEVTFKDIVLFARTGLNPRQNFKLGTGTNKYITIKNIYDNKLIIDDDTDLVDDEAIKLIHKRSKIKKGDVLFCSIGKIGDMYIIEDNPVGWDINESVFAFTLNEEIIRQKYFYYYFKSRKAIGFLEKNSSGSTFKSIKMEKLKEMVFELPSLEEQNRIIKELDSLLAIIKENNRQLSILDKTIKARFAEMFGDVMINEKGWKTSFLSDVAPANSPSIDLNEKVWLLNLDMIESQSGRIIEKVFVPKNSINASTCAFDNNNVLYSKLRPYLNKVVLPDQEGYCTTELIPLRPNKLLTREFLATILRSDGFVKYINEKTAGAKMPRVSMDIFRQFKCILPPIELQKDFSSFYNQIDKTKAIIRKSINKTQLLFDSLMQEYFG